jgi:DNA-binding HxlR family transcriptional regulator
MQWNELSDQDCSMARTLAVIGDRWTLLILRECFLRVRRFDEFQERLGIGRPILADRLQKLVANFVLTKVAYQETPTRYEYRLTPKGRALYPVILSIVHWGDVHLAGKKGRPVLHEHLACGHVFDPVMSCSKCDAALEPRDVRVLPGPGMRSGKRLPVNAEPPAKAQTRLSGSRSR